MAAGNPAFVSELFKGEGATGLANLWEVPLVRVSLADGVQIDRHRVEAASRGLGQRPDNVFEPNKQLIAIFLVVSSV